MINTWLDTELEVKDLKVLDMYLARLEDEVELAILKELEKDQKATETRLKTKVDPTVIEPVAAFLRNTFQYGIIVNDQDKLEKITNDNGVHVKEVKVELTIRW